MRVELKNYYKSDRFQWTLAAVSFERDAIWLILLNFGLIIRLKNNL